MSPSYRHRRSRPFHQFRHGWYHAKLHRTGVRHRHKRGEKLQPPEAFVANWRAVPRRLWPKEIRTQLLLGALFGVVVLIVISVVLSILAFDKARSDLTKAQDIAREITEHRTILLSANGRAEAAADLANMHYYAAKADDELNDSFGIAVLKLVPLVGNQVSSLTGTVHDVNILSEQGQLLLASAINAVQASHGTSISLPAVRELDAQVHSSTTTLAALDTSAGGLWGPARTEREKLDTQLQTIIKLLRRGGDALNFAQPFLGADGPRVYLVVGENNSEMRDQGAVLSWALLHADDGTFTMTNAASVGTIALSRPAIAISNPATEAAFGAFDPTQIWQSVNANGNFPTSARWMITMFKAATGIQVDGVVAVDVQVLTNLLKVTGPVHVAAIKQKVTTRNVAPLLLYKLYTKYPVGSQDARHDDITAVAQAAVHKMRNGHYDVGAFLESLAKASQGRHLLFYDTSPSLEHAVDYFGGSGELLADGGSVIHLAMEAGVAAKIDWFMHTSVTYDVRIDQRGTAYYTVTMLLHNDAPPNAPASYALGPKDKNHVPGEYDARLFLWLPRGSFAPGVLTEENLSLLRAIRNVYPGQTQEVVFTATQLNAVRHGRFSLQFIPQGLIHPSHITVQFTSANAFNGPTQVSWLGNKFVTLHWTSQ